jgi:signal transduction histidine kinase
MATKDDIIAVKGDIISMQQKLGDKIDTLYGIIIAAFVTLIAVIAVPQIIIAYRERRESQLSKEVDDLKQRIAELEKKRILT